MTAFLLAQGPSPAARPFLTPGGWFLACLLVVIILMLWRVGSKLGGFMKAAHDLLAAAKMDRGTAELVRDDAKHVAADVLHSAAKVATTVAVETVKVVGGAAGSGVHKTQPPADEGKAS